MNTQYIAMLIQPIVIPHTPGFMIRNMKVIEFLFEITHGSIQVCAINNFMLLNCRKSFANFIHLQSKNIFQRILNCAKFHFKGLRILLGAVVLMFRKERYLFLMG